MLRRAARTRVDQDSARSQPSRPRGRPSVISRERLLEIAREVFLEHGIRATTAEVAARAGVAEGTIFLRFKSKGELFRAAMNFDPDQALAFVESLPGRAGASDLRGTLLEFAEQFIRLGRVAVPVTMMSWSNPDYPGCLDRGSDRGARYRRMLAAVSAFFEAEMRARRLKARNVEALARMLVGSLHHYCMSEIVSEGQAGQLGESEFAAEVVDVLLAAAGFEAPPRRRTQARRRVSRVGR